METISLATPYGYEEALHWFLSTEESMWQALKYLLGQQHRGAISVWPDGNDGFIWLMEVNDYEGNSASAQIGEHLVLVSGSGIKAMPSDVYNNLVQE